MSEKIFIAGHQGMVGSAILKKLKVSNPGLDVVVRNRQELDLTNQNSVAAFFRKEAPDIVVLAAAKVGGIHANNTFPAEFIYENLMIETNVIHQAHVAGVQRLLFLGSSCIYPKHADQPMPENALLSGKLEPTNEPYAIAKIAGIKLCESYNRQYGRDYRSVMPTNLYGPGDNFHEKNSHVLPALLRRFHEAARDNLDSVLIWGSGRPQREFLHVDDMADASLFVLNLPKSQFYHNRDEMLSHVNIGSGIETSIAELSEMIAEITGFTGEILYDDSKPDGTMRKFMDVSGLTNLGWNASTSLNEGIRFTYDWYLENMESLRN